MATVNKANDVQQMMKKKKDIGMQNVYWSIADVSSSKHKILYLLESALIMMKTRKHIEMEGGCKVIKKNRNALEESEIK